jgi:hypothetical protein
VSLLLLPVDAPLAPDPGAAADAARAELGKPAYTTQEPSLLQRVSEWILGRIGDLLGRADSNGPGGTIATVIVLVLIALAAVALWTRLGPRGAHRPGASGVFAQPELTAAEHHAAADAALRDGDLATAVLERFRALVRGCEERGLLVPRPGRTAEEVAAELAVLLPDASAAVHAAATAFGEVRYGGRPATDERHAAVADADRTVRAHRERIGTG